MATIEKRTADGKTTYRVKIRLRGYPSESATFERMSDAKAWAQKIESDMRAGRYFGEAKRHTFGELADKYLADRETMRLRSFSDRKRQVTFWRGVFGDHLLHDVTPARISTERDNLLEEVDADGERRRDGPTVTRYLAALSACLSYGVESLQWLESNPCRRIKMPSENQGRVRFLSDDERDRLLAACRASADPHLLLAVILSLTTGARQGEVMGLRWTQVDFQRRVITLHETKNGDRRALPLAGEAFTLLLERSKVRSLHDDRVFVIERRQRPFAAIRPAWEAALEAAGVKDFHWHDIRHTAASYLTMAGVSPTEIARVTGHRTMQMLARYSHLSDEHVVKLGDLLAQRMGLS